MQRSAAAVVFLLAALLGASAARAQPPSWLFEHPFLPHRSRIGVQVQPMTEELREHMGAPRDRGVLVTRVEPGRAASEAGLEVGDVIVGAGGEPVRAVFDLVKAVGTASAGSSLALEIVRGGEKRALRVEPEGDATPWVDPEQWQEWFDRGVRRGRDELRDRLEELEKRLDELERRLGEPAPDGSRET